MNSETMAIAEVIVEQLSSATLVVEVEVELDVNPSFVPDTLPNKVQVKVTPKTRRSTTSARGVLDVEHDIMIAILAPLNLEGNHDTATLEALEEQLETWFFENDLQGRNETLMEVEVAAIFSPKAKDEQSAFMSGFTLTFLGAKLYGN